MTLPHESTRKGENPRLLDFADVNGDGSKNGLLPREAAFFVAKVSLQANGLHYAHLSGKAERLCSPFAGKG